MTWTSAIVTACVVGATVGAPAQPLNPADAIAAEVARIEKASDALGSQAEGVTTALVRVKDALAKGRVLLALDELQEPWVTERAIAWAAAHGAIRTSAQFSAEWKRVGEPAWGAPTSRQAAAVEAIAASNASRAPATWRASLPYSEDAGMEAGLYYLGEAQAYAAFATFSRSLAMAPAGKPLALGPLGSEISALESRVATMYDKAPADMKPRFIRVSVGLKVAHTLDDHKDYGAALYQYLSALYRVTASTATGAPDGDVKARLAGARAGLAAGDDHSIALLFFERAAYLLDLNDPSATRSAGVIADTVIPAYLKMVQR
ncbi:MAG TPA: hypothetical protein VF147_15790 [Vicinamibacterales bacterium]